MNICVMALGTNADYFAQDDARFGENVQRYYELCRERDLCLTHTLVPIQTGRATPPRQQPPHVPLSVVEENTDGVIVKGARMLATLAPFSDELVNCAQPLLTHPDEEIYALAFAIPVATPGLRFLYRDSFDRQGSHFDRPVSSRFDEMDAIAVFDHVLIPWERLFIYRNMDLHNRIVPATKFLSHIAVHVAVLPEDIATYFQSSAGLTGEDRVRLNRLVWDVCGSEFGGRQELYERFFAGAPTRRLSQTYVRANLEADIRLVEGLLGVSLPVMQQA